MKANVCLLFIATLTSAEVVNAQVLSLENRTTNYINTGETYNYGQIEVGVMFGDGGSPDNLLSISAGSVVSSGRCLMGSGDTGRNNQLEVLGSGSRLINQYDLAFGYKRGSGNRLIIADGGGVECSNGWVGAGYADKGSGNVATISGINSYWNVSNVIGVGLGTSTYRNGVMVEDGGSVTSTHVRISGGGVWSFSNWIEVTGEHSQWVNHGDMSIGYMGQRNSMEISHGGVVTTENSFIGQHGVSNGEDTNNEGDNYVRVEGSGSKWKHSGILTIGNAEDLGGDYLTITNGGEAVAKRGVIIHGTNNSLNLDSGGRLTIGTNFNASMVGFSYNEGSTLAVEGQLTGLSTLEADRRLEAVSVLGDMTVHGTFAAGNSPADSILDGILTIAVDRILEMELGGYLLGEEYDRLTVTETAYLDGTLDVVLLDGFTLSYGDSFDLFNWKDDHANGEFATITTSALTGDLEWDTSELYTNGTLSVIPEPSSLAMAGIVCGLGLVIRRKFML